MEARDIIVLLLTILILIAILGSIGALIYHVLNYDVPIYMTQEGSINGSVVEEVVYSEWYVGKRDTNLFLQILALLVFFHVWSDLLWAIIFLRSESNWTLMVAIGQYEGEFTSDITQIMAILLVSMIPPIIIYLFVQKYFAKGIIRGSFR